MVTSFKDFQPYFQRFCSLIFKAYVLGHPFYYTEAEGLYPVWNLCPRHGNSLTHFSNKNFVKSLLTITRRPLLRNTCTTVWKFRNYPTSQILRENSRIVSISIFLELVFVSSLKSSASSNLDFSSCLGKYLSRPTPSHILDSCSIESLSMLKFFSSSFIL